MARPPRIARTTIALLLGFALGVSASSLASGPEPGPAARRVLEEARFQTELPGGLDADASAETTRGESGWERRVLPEGALRLRSAVARALAWVVAIGLLFGALLLLIRELTGKFGRRRWGEPGGESLGVATAGPGVPLGPIDESRIDAAIAGGEFAEAIHLLLLSALDRLRRARGVAVPDAATGRELLGTLTIDRAGRGALRELVGAVEITRFGGRPATAEDAARARDAWGRIVSGTGADAGSSP